MTRDGKEHSSGSSRKHSLYLHNRRITEGERKESENDTFPTHRYVYKVIYIYTAICPVSTSGPAASAWWVGWGYEWI